MKTWALSLFLAALSAAGEKAAPKPRPEQWATPLAVAGLKNFHQLDGKVYRCAQPDRKGFAAAQQLGIKNVLNLRDNRSDAKAAKGLGLNLFRVEMEADEIDADQVVEALRIIKDAEGPILIHCWHGSDRTGAVSAMYRIVFQNWTREEALDELMHGGYGYHKMFRNITRFIRTADVAEISRRVGVPAAAQGAAVQGAVAPGADTGYRVARRLGQGLDLSAAFDSPGAWADDCLIRRACDRKFQILEPCPAGDHASTWEELSRRAPELAGQPVRVRGPLVLGNSRITLAYCQNRCCNVSQSSLALGGGAAGLLVLDRGECKGDESRQCCNLPAFGQSVIASGKLVKAEGASDWTLAGSRLCAESPR